MTYHLKLSSKNQVTIPVALLRDLNVSSSKKTKTKQKGQKNDDIYLTVVKNLQGKYELVNPFEMLKELQGSLKSPKNLENVSDEELEEKIVDARKIYTQKKYSKYASN